MTCKDVTIGTQLDSATAEAYRSATAEAYDSATSEAYHSYESAAELIGDAS